MLSIESRINGTLTERERLHWLKLIDKAIRKSGSDISLPIKCKGNPLEAITITPFRKFYRIAFWYDMPVTPGSCNLTTCLVFEDVPAYSKLKMFALTIALLFKKGIQQFKK